MFSVTSDDKDNDDNDTECSTTAFPNRHNALVLSRTKIKWCTIHVQICQKLLHADY